MSVVREAQPRLTPSLPALLPVSYCDGSRSQQPTCPPDQVTRSPCSLVAGLVSTGLQLRRSSLPTAPFTSDSNACEW